MVVGTYILKLIKNSNCPTLKFKNNINICIKGYSKFGFFFFIKKTPNTKISF